MSEWWEDSQPRGATSPPPWAIALFVIAVGAMGAALWYGDTKTVVAALGTATVAALKFLGRKGSKLADARAMSWPTERQRPSAAAPKDDPKLDVQSFD